MCIIVIFLRLVTCHYDFVFQKYLDEAENDKQRYIDELKQFQKSDMYQTLVKKKRLKGETGGEGGFFPWCGGGGGWGVGGDLSLHAQH